MNLGEKETYLDEKLKDEVGDLHPLLKNIFTKNEKIKSVDYTHGVNEMGADFILKREDDIFGTFRYVGVIVKNKKIQQDYTDIERQISECLIPKMVEGGKKEILVEEIWVITSKQISNNGKRSINHKFKQHSIHFVEKEALIKWIDQYWPDYWSDFSFHLGVYFSNMKNKMVQLNERFNLLTTQKPVYFERSVYYTANDDGKRIKIEPQKLLKENKFVYLESGAGFGKSRLVRKLVEDLCDPAFYKKNPIIPIFSTYFEFLNTFDGKLCKLFESAITNDIKKEAHAETTYIFFIDGIDEVPDEFEKQSEILKSVKDEACLNDKYKVFVSSRPVFSVNDKNLTIENSLTIKLLPMEKKQVVDLIKHICKSFTTSKRLLSDLSKSVFIRDIARTPISAILLSAVLQDNDKDLPQNLTELYNKYTELMLGRWDLQKGLGLNKQYEVGKVFLENLATYFSENGLNQIGTEEAKSRLSEYLHERNIEMGVESIFDVIVDRSGLVVRDAFSGTLFFKHKSFMDYFSALYYYHNKELEVDERVFNPYWSSVYFFYIGQRKDCEAYLEKVLKYPTREKVEIWNKGFLFPDYLLAATQTPYSVVERNLKDLIYNYYDVYYEFSSFENVNPVSKSKLSIIYLFVYLVRNGYGYSYFSKALTNVIGDIDKDLDIPIEKKVYSLFLVAVALLEIGDDFGLKYLIEEYSKELPLEIKFAIKYESKSLEVLPGYIKKALKKLDEDLKNSKGLRVVATNLHKKQIQ